MSVQIQFKILKKLFLIFILFAILFFNRCKDDPSGPVNYGPNKALYEVEYSSNTIILPSDALISIDTVNYSIYTLDKNKVTTKLQPNDILIISEKAMRKVINCKEEDNFIIVETTEAKLNEAIKNGKISWDFTPDLSKVTQVLINKKYAVPLKNNGDGYEYEFEIGNWTFQVWMNPKGTAENGLPELQINFIAVNKACAGGKITATLGAKGSTRLPRQNAEININNNQTTSFSTKNRGSHSELTLEYSAVFSEGGGTAILELPEIVLRMPLSVLLGIALPIPIYIDYGISLGATVNIPSVTATAIGKVKLILDSDEGLKVENTAPTFQPSINDKSLGELWFDIGDMSISPAPAEVKYNVACPKVSLNIAGQEIAWLASVFRTDAVLMVPSLCKAAFCQVRLDGGYKLGMLGFNFDENETTFFEYGKEVKTPECP